MLAIVEGAKKRLAIEKPGAPVSGDYFILYFKKTLSIMEWAVA